MSRVEANESHYRAIHHVIRTSRKIRAAREFRTASSSEALRTLAALASERVSERASGETEKQRGEIGNSPIGAESSTESNGGKRSRSKLWSSSGLSAVERQAFPKHRGTRPTPGGGRQQVTTGQTYTNNSRERFYSPLSFPLPPLALPLSLLLSYSLPPSPSSFLSLTFVVVDQPVVRRGQSIYRPSTETRRYVEHT